MRNTLTIWAILISTITIYSQIGKVTYTAQMDEKPISINDTLYKIKNEMADIVALNSKDVKYDLIFNKIKSQYNKIDELKNDNVGVFNFTALLAGGNSTFYTNIKDSICYEFVEDGGQSFLVKRKHLLWKITAEKKQIGKYTCYKATTSFEIEVNEKLRKKTIIAWFAKDLSFPFGPKNYHGLPGLILQIFEDGLKLTATNIMINQDEITTFKKEKKGKLVSEKEYNLILKKLDEEEGF